MFADVILPLNLPQAFTYGVPLEMQDRLMPGMRVEVSLGNNKQYSGIVDKLHQNRPEAYQVKPVRGILDKVPVVSERQLQFWRWIAGYYMAAPGEVMQAALPAHMKLVGETRLDWCGDPTLEYEWSPAAEHAAAMLAIRKELTISELREMTGAGQFAETLNELIEKGAVTINEGLETHYRPKKERIVTLNPEHASEEALKMLFKKLEKAPRQLEVLMAYTELSVKHGIVRLDALVERADANNAVVKIMTEKGLFVVESRQVDRIIYPPVKEERAVVFTPAQQAAYDELNEGLQQKPVALLQGVTGSGKTLLYIRKIRECLAMGKQALLLLPEIGLTTQLVSRLHAWFGDAMGVYHSHFSNNERVEIWEKVHKGAHKVVVGPRSALWLPYKELGLVIVDEEHDSSYKQRDPAPRFHARDAAIYLGLLHGAQVILGSATPSVESLFNAQQQKYAFVLLKDRYLGVRMPEIEVVHAKSLEAVRNRGLKLLGPELQAAMLDALQHRKQVILFQNRRGYAPFQLCTICGWTPQCKNCSVSLTYHKSTDKLHCHYCGSRSAVVQVCPQCGSTRLSSKTFGTEKIEEEVRQVFPEIRIARMDVDSMRGKNSMTELLDKFEKRKIDVLVGTQMVVKGLDFASVGLVGILSADSLLSFPDFRVNERAFQLMEQVSGRSGRVDGKGRVLIQAYNMVHPVLHFVKEHDVTGFYEKEIQYRAHFVYPPFSRLIKISFRHVDENKAIEAAGKMAGKLKDYPGINVQGPGAAIVARVRNQYIQEIWIKCPRDNKMLDLLKVFLKDRRQELLALRGYTSVVIGFDVDPV